jgi:hypothetical protein
LDWHFLYLAIITSGNYLTDKLFMKHKKNQKQNKDWLDWWLSDEPPPPEVESQLKSPTYVPLPEELLPRQELPPEPGSTNITVNVNVPKLKKEHLEKLKNRLRQRDVARAATFVFGMMLLGLATHSFIFKSPLPAVAKNTGSHQVLAESTQNTDAPTESTSLTPSVDSTAAAPSQAATEPTTTTDSSKASFTPVAPVSEPELGQYAFAKTSYDSSSGIYTYMDTVDGTTISVSEQQVPSNYSSPQAAVSQTATSIGATQTFTVDSGTAYIYTNPTNGQQTVVFSLFNILISINSELARTASQWQAYINALH